jgi:lysophospholipase L1-like esterase
MRFYLSPRWAVLALFCLALPGPASAAGIPTYLAVGDSLAFGFTDDTTPSYGDRGYVADYANYLGATTGIRPYVVNLGVYGETTSTFLNGASGSINPSQFTVGGTYGNGSNSSGPMNLNYTDTTTSQNSLMLSTIAAAKTSGDPINTVSVQIGANDLFAAAAAPGFFTETATQQAAQIQQTLATVGTNVATILGELKSQLPNTNVVVMGYYNPYAAVPSNPFSAVAGPAIQGLNSVLQADAQAFGDRFVNTYTPFLGNEAQDTYIATSGSLYNVHPNAQGYQLIADQMEVPEPSTLIVLGAGLGGLLLNRRRFGRS